MGHHCCSKQKVKRGLWSPEEDEKLIKCITTHGHGCWSSVPKLAGLQRCGKSCRLRWINYLRPDLKRGSFSAQEERIIIDVHRILGNRWAQIAKHLPGRTDNEVKNFWNSCIKKKLIAQGLDPKTHNLITSSSSSSIQHHHHQYNHNFNACISHYHPNQQHHNSVFSMNMINPTTSTQPFMITLPAPNPQPANEQPFPLHQPMNNISTINYGYQNPNLTWATSGDPSVFKDQLQVVQSGQFGVISEENCMWDGNVESFESLRLDDEEMQPIPPPCALPLPQEEGRQVGKEDEEQGNAMFGAEFDETNEVMINKESNYNNSTTKEDYMETMMSPSSFSSNNFDLEFIDSTIMSCGLYSSNIMSSPMDQLAWDC